MSFSIPFMKREIARACGEVLGLHVDPEWVEFANPKAGSHLALPCFRFSKELELAPNEIANKIALTLTVDGVSRVEAQGPYVNFWVESDQLVAGVRTNLESSLSNKSSLNKTIIVEFLSPNLAKPLSIGHYRNVMQGRAIALMYQNAGYKVITDNHIGDWGTVFGMWVVGFEHFSSDEKLATGGVEELGRMYIEMRKALKAEEGSDETPLADAVQDWLLKLEQKDPKAWDYHARFSDISLESISKQMSELDIVFDHNLGESFYVERGKQMVEELLASGDALRNEDGSVVVPLDEQGVDTPMLIQKSNGAALYHTSDIATIEYREKTWNPDLVIYVVGMEQQFHFKQLFAANQKVGWSDAELIHHWYGLIEEVGEDGKRQKMSSRKSAVYMADLIELARKRAREIAPDDLSDDDVNMIAMGALTFQEFSASHTGNTVFDWDAMFSLHGFSGPYVQYATVRIKSVLNKAESIPNLPPSSFDWQAYTEELWVLNKFDGVIDDATAEREYHKVAEYAYELARVWNRFYENNPILQSEGVELDAKLWLAQSIGAHLERALNLLGIHIPTKM